MATVTHRLAPVPALLCLAALGSLLAPLLVSAPMSAQEVSAREEPRAVPVEPVHDVGQVPAGSTIEHAFVIENQGEEPVEITEVRASCGCTVAEFDREIAPGGEGTVRAKVETKSFRGPIAKSVTVFTDDPANPRIELVVKADVEVFVEVEPGYARFVQVEGAGATTSEQVIWSPGRPDLQVLDVVPPPFLADLEDGAAVREGTDEGGVSRWVVRLTLPADAPTGSLSGKVIVETDHPKQPRIEIPVVGLVRPMLTVRPPVADFGKRLLEGPFLASLEIRNQTDQPIGLTAVRSDVPGVSAEIEPLQEGRRYQLRVTLTPPMPEGEFAGLLTITTDSADKPRLEVEVKGTVVGPLW